MSEVKIIINYKGIITTALCSIDDKIEDIFKTIENNIQKKTNELFFCYNGIVIDINKKFSEIINKIDKERKEMDIIAFNIQSTIIDDKYIQSKDIICPKCNESILININEYKINIYSCKNGHEKKNIKFSEFEDIQKINLSKIICEKCRVNNMGNTYNNEFFRCLKCNINICPLCKSCHDNNHNIIEYNKMNYICNIHNEIYIKYCKRCRKNMCKLCEKDHYNHEKIYYENILTNENRINELKDYVGKLKNEIKDIIFKLNNLLINMDQYYEISNKIINNTNRNYEILVNKNEFMKYNNIIINDIKNIIDHNDIEDKIKDIINIYNKMNLNNKNKDINNPENYVIAEVKIKNEDINKNIRIINSYEQAARENNWGFEKKCQNEKEIKDNCEILINNKLIKFNYYHKFNKEGNYTIQYSFKQNLKNINHLFYGCESLTNIDLSKFNTQNVINMRSIFCDCKSLIKINLSNLNTQNVIYMYGIFSGCESLININLSDFKTENVIDMSYMFYECKSLININLFTFNTQNVTDMSYMFSGCISLININLFNFNTQNVTDMSYMFSGCESLTNINLFNFKTENVTNMRRMFNRCKSLTNINLSDFNTQKVTKMSDIFYGCTSLTKNNVITKDKNLLNELI